MLQYTLAEKHPLLQQPVVCERAFPQLATAYPPRLRQAKNAPVFVQESAADCDSANMATPNPNPSVSHLPFYLHLVLSVSRSEYHVSIS